MFSRNKKQPETKRKHDLSQFGIFGVPDEDMDNDDGDDSGGDSDLEAELAAITSGGRGRSKPKTKPKTIVPPSELDKMVAESLRDIGSDEELSGDDDDPDLLNELSEITGDPAEEEPTAPPTETAAEMSPVAESVPAEPILPTTTLTTADTLKERLAMYKLAEKNAKDAGDNSRARRFNRGVKTIEQLLKQALAGRPINNDDIPPAVAVKPAHPQPSADNVASTPSPVTPTTPPTPLTPPASSDVPAIPSAAAADPPQPEPSTAVDEQIINTLLARQREYKMAALNAKKSGETANALQYVKVIKIFDKVLEMARQGKPVDLSDMPPPPSELPADVLRTIGQAPSEPQKQEETVQKATENPEVEPAPAAPAAPAARSAPEEPPSPPKTIMEALEQRLAKYQSQEAHAKEEGNSSKVRRMGRIVKQYQDAIKAHKAGRPVPFDELPTPPGFEPIPVGNAAPAPSASPSAPAVPAVPAAKTTPTRPPLKKQDSRISGNHSVTSVMNKSIEILLERQREFKEAALEAKQAGELEQAKEYLKTFKGIESLLNVARGGMPVDLSTLPISPKQREKLDESFTMVDKEETDPAPETSAELKELFTRLEAQLQTQLEKCRTWSTHHNALGDIAGKNRFDNLALTVQRDLDIVKLAHRRGNSVPKFNIETKSFNIVQCNTDLAETELEINVVRGIGYNVPKAKEIDTYVKVEFPYPQETPYRNKTAVIYDTDSPEYNEKFLAEIQPKARLCQRVFKRQNVKVEIFSKGGFFRSDALIGTATVKLQPLETACEIHDSFDLMDGRKSVGGKIEVKIRIRNPILQKQVINEAEKWLTLL